MNQIVSPATIDTQYTPGRTPVGLHPLFHYGTLPLRLILVAASTVAVVGIFALSMTLHCLRLVASALPGARKLAGWFYNLYHGIVGRLGKRVLADERDEPILAAVLSLTLCVLPIFVAQLLLYEINGYLVIAYYTIVFGPKIRGFVRSFSAWHQEVHRPGGILKGRSPFERVFGFTWCAFLLGLPMGLIQSGVAHVQQHHRENGNYEDAFSSAQYNHASLWDFYRHLLRDVFHQVFLTTPYAYFRRRGRNELATVQIKGNLLYFAVVAPVFFYSWQIAALYVLVPWFATAFILGLVNWTQHPFYGGRDDSLNYMTNTLTVLETPVNFLNEGYHLSHHQRSGIHWTENPAFFASMRDKMKKAGSMVFRDLGVTEIFLLLTVCRAFGVLARKLEPWEPMSHAEKVALIRRRSGPAPAQSTRQEPASVTPTERVAVDVLQSSGRSN